MSSSRPRSIALATLVAALAALAGCGSSGARRATTTLPMPAEVPARHEAMDELGRRLHVALAAGHPEHVMLGDDELRALLGSTAATRVAARRAAIGVRLGGDAQRLTIALDGTTYLGVCLQDARDEPGDATLGLRATGWVFRRVLLAAARPGGRRVALWIDGVFVFTDAGFGALDLERVEDPRPEHSDLELAPCDMATSLR